MVQELVWKKMAHKVMNCCKYRCTLPLLFITVLKASGMDCLGSCYIQIICYRLNGLENVKSLEDGNRVWNPEASANIGKPKMIISNMNIISAKKWCLAICCMKEG